MTDSFLVTKVVLITGAGASKKLAREGAPDLPLMEDWARVLREHFGEQWASMAGLDLPSTGQEFEETLGALFRWGDSLDGFERFAPMTKPSPNHDETIPQTVLQAIENGRANLERVTEALHTTLYAEFGPARLDPARCEAAYRELFRMLAFGKADLPDELICATTNYDRSLEMAFAGLGVEPRTGFRPHPFLTSELDAQGLGKFVPGSPSVIYLHGAVGWHVTDSGSIVSRAANEGYNPSLGRPAVLYPDPTKEIERAETRDLWREFISGFKQRTSF